MWHRYPEAESDLAQDVDRDDDRCQMQARVPDAREYDRILPIPDTETCGGWPWSQAQGWHIRKSDITDATGRALGLQGLGSFESGTPYIPRWMTAVEYNYDRFDEYVESGAELVEFSAFPNHLHAGDPRPGRLAYTAR